MVLRGEKRQLLVASRKPFLCPPNQTVLFEGKLPLNEDHHELLWVFKDSRYKQKAKMH